MGDKHKPFKLADNAVEQETTEHDSETKPTSPAGDDLFAAIEFEFDVLIGAATDTGLVRERNEDHYAVIRRTRRCEMLKTNLPESDSAFVDNQSFGMLVADGVGGESFGHFASQLVLETIFQAAGLATNWLMKFKNLEAQQVQQRIDAYVSRIKDAFRSHAELDPEKSRMGTTLTAAYLMPPHLIVAHIGDSRAYLVRNSSLLQITRDHTVAQAMIDAGANKEDVRGLGHILINNLDPVRDEIIAEIMHVELQPGDHLLLCTDGLSDLVDSNSIVRILESNKPQAACQELIDAANAEGGKDNITVIVAEMLE